MLTNNKSETIQYHPEITGGEGENIPERLEALLAPLATNAGLLVSAEDGLRRRLLEAVDEDRAGLQSLADALGALDVLAPDAGAQTGERVVRAADDLFFVGPGLCWDDGTCSINISLVHRHISLGGI